ncbi:MAG: lipid-A-disaccharide synthase [Candidatus Zixiibacteriota bacterium]|nr:MAG: lipid-A-disaccharide synthase [candidate division Zixibacteria bacterium]
MDTLPVFLSAGDLSGDTASSLLVSQLAQLRPGCRFFGLGGQKLRRAGQKQLADPADLAVLGFWEVARNFLFFRRLLDRCRREIDKEKPVAAILVDYPGFNLRLARDIKRRGIPVIYYISPQVWAWGRRRITAIKRLVDLMIVILPFEEPFYAGYGLQAKFVGHYLLEDIPGEYISSPVSVSGRKVLAILPGSRPQEIKRMLPPMLEAAARFNRTHGTRAVVAGISDMFDYEEYVGQYRDYGIEIVWDDSRKVIYDSSLVLTASGTATLEAAIIGRPMVVAYRTALLTYQIARSLIKLDRIALANIVLGEKIVPELIQGEATADRIAAELARYLSDPAYFDRVKQKLDTVAAFLGGRGASRRAAEMMLKYLER